MRLWIGLALAVLVNLGLFTLMQQMTSTKHVESRKAENVQLLEFVRVKRDEQQAEAKQRQLPKPPPPKKPPPPPTPPQQQVSQPKTPTPKMSVPKVEVPLNIAGKPYLGDVAKSVPEAESIPAAEPVAVQGPIVDNEVIPIVRIQPRYPRKAARRNIEGSVTVSFTITKDGRVRDARVLKATPEGVFDKEALKAILKWKFKPKMLNGEAVERTATQEIEFNLK